MVLGRKLAAGVGDWEEGAPEDLLPALRFSSALGVAVLHGVSSRVRARCEATVTKLEANAARALVVASEYCHRGSAGSVAKRCVRTEVLSALQVCARTLLAPAVYCDPRLAEASVATKLNGLLATASSEQYSCSALSTIAGQFGASTAADVLQGFLGQVLWLLLLL